MKKILAAAAMIVLVAPTLISAQVAEESVTPPVIIVENATPSSEAQEAEVELEATNNSQQQEAAEGVQETVNTQPVVENDTLEDTANPEDALTDETEVIEVVEATSTEEIIVVVEEVPFEETDVVEEMIIEETVLDVVEQDIPVDVPTEQVEIVAEVTVAAPALKAEVEPSYVFALSGKTLPTKMKAGDTVESVTATIDNAEGILTVAGTCSDVYYVVLLYKNATDYETDPRSYIINRAYPCVDGAYSYDVDRIPVSVQNGTYYLLIGEQGERGAWRPATALTEIVINRSN